MAGKTNGKFTEIYSVQGEMKQSQPVLLTYTKYTGFWPAQHKLNQVKLILIAKIPLQDMIEKTFHENLWIFRVFLNQMEPIKVNSQIRSVVYKSQ